MVLVSISTSLQQALVIGLFLYTRNGRRRELGLGGYLDTSLVEARAKIGRL
jgi:hypothetical protein